MKAQFIRIVDDGQRKKIYRRLFCYSIIGTKEFGVKLAVLSVIKDNKKSTIGVPIALGNSETSLSETIELLKKEYKLIDVYVDRDAVSVMNREEYNTIDVYFEKY